MTELESIVKRLTDYVIGVCQIAWEPDEKFTILPANIPTKDRVLWVRLTDGFNFSFENQTPISDEVTFSFTCTLHFRKKKGISSEEQITFLSGRFYDTFYYSLHPGSVGYLPQVSSLHGYDIEEKDDYAEIEAQVTVKSYITRTIVSRDDTVVLNSSGILVPVTGDPL
jgi:hypothetical protein